MTASSGECLRLHLNKLPHTHAHSMTRVLVSSTHGAVLNRISPGAGSVAAVAVKMPHNEAVQLNTNKTQNLSGAIYLSSNACVHMYLHTRFSSIFVE